MTSPVIIIAAMSGDRVIGEAGGMPWDIPEEYAQFLRQVEGQTIIMGRRSFEIFGPDLTRCDLIVVSRSPSSGRHFAWIDTFDDALLLARQRPQTIFIGGGASIYQQALAHADRLHLSVIHGTYQGDTYFPDFSRQEWQVAKSEHHSRYDYFEYVRRGP